MAKIPNKPVSSNPSINRVFINATLMVGTAFRAQKMNSQERRRNSMPGTLAMGVPPNRPSHSTTRGILKMLKPMVTWGSFILGNPHTVHCKILRLVILNSTIRWMVLFWTLSTKDNEVYPSNCFLQNCT